MLEDENVTVNRNDFEADVAKNFKALWNDHAFTDVTLAAEDDHQIRVHKVILSSCSRFFGRILLSNPHPNPLIYLKGIKYKQLELVIKFIYAGQCEVAQKDLEGFLETGKELMIQGLMEITNIPKKEEIFQDNKLDEEISQSNHDIFVPVKSNLIEPKESEKTKEHFKLIDTSDENVIKMTSEAVVNLPYQSQYSENKVNMIKQKSVYKCKMCEKSYRGEHSLLGHMKSSHEGIRFQCKKCDFQAKRKSILTGHTRFIHDGIGFKCDKCDRKFAQTSGLQRHKENAHSVQRPVDDGNEGIKYGCNQCDFQSHIFEVLMAHKSINH